MTEQDRRVANQAARDLDEWALTLPAHSETRQDLQQTARAYRFVARTGAPRLNAVPKARLRAVPEPPYPRGLALP